MDEYLKSLKSLTDEPIAGRILRGSRDNYASMYANALANMPTNEERFEFMSAARAIGEMAEQINKYGEKAPDGKHLLVTMLTPDGRIMIVEKVTPQGFGTFMAEGYIDELPCMTVSHSHTFTSSARMKRRKERPE